MDFANNSILLILTSLVFIYAVLSILVSILTEWWNSYFKERGTFLKDSIYKLLKDPLNKDYGYLFYNHVTISGLKSAPDRNPHYVSGAMFAEVLIDIIAQQVLNNRPINVVINPDGTREYHMDNAPVPPDIVARFQLGVSSMNASPFADLMQSFIDKSAHSENQYADLKSHLEKWFNDYMDRVSGWYKTKQRKKLLVIGFAVTILLNVDSLHLVKALSLDPDLRNRLVTSAEQTVDTIKKDSLAMNNASHMMETVFIVKDSLSNSGVVRIDTARFRDFLTQFNQLNNARKINDSLAMNHIRTLDSTLSLVSDLNIPIGWSESCAPASWFSGSARTAVMHNPGQNTSLTSYLNQRNQLTFGNVLSYLIGIIISGISLSFGAPFWFDLLTKFINIRRSGKIPEGNPSTKS